VLADKNAAWPDSMTTGAGYRYRGYSLDNAGRPTFKYTLGTAEVREQLVPEANGQQLKHQFTVTGNSNNIWCRVATGKIKALTKDLYSINDKQFLVSFAGAKARPVIRTVGAQQELVVPVQDNQVSYTLIW
jgi:hypothetical protein